MKRWFAEIEAVAGRSPWMWFTARLSRSKRWTFSALLMLGATSVLWQCDPLVLKWLVDTILPDRRLDLVFVASILILAIQSGRLLTLSGGIFANAQCGQKIAAELRREVFRKTCDLSAETIERERTGDIVYSLEQDIDQVVSLGSDILPTLTRIILTTGLSIAMMWRIDGRLTLITCANIPLAIACGCYSRSPLKKSSEKSRLADAERSTFSSEAIAASVQIRILNAFRRILHLYDVRVDESTRTHLAESRAHIVYGFASLFVVVLASTLMLGTGGLLVIHDRMSIGSYIAFYTYLLRLFDPIETKAANLGIRKDVLVHLLSKSPRKKQRRLLNQSGSVRISLLFALPGSVS